MILLFLYYRLGFCQVVPIRSKEENCSIIITTRMSARLVVDVICDRGRGTKGHSGRQTPSLCTPKKYLLYIALYNSLPYIALK